MTMIASLVAQLPEVYQPIFGHPELSENSSRACQDRLTHIVDIYRVAETVLGRPPKVLDLGCAQGFFSLNLAALGAQVHGIDYLEQNVQVCEALRDEHPDIQAQFTFGKIQDLLDTIEADQYDMVLGLSVFHHLVYDLGKESVRDMLELLLHKVTVFVGEFALAEEPLYWGEAQPQDPRYLLCGSAFLHELSRHPTHLADIQRPLYVASNRLWYLDGMGQRIEAWTPDSHALAAGAHQGARRYYLSDDYFVKVLRVDGRFGERNQTELVRESQFLQSPPPGFDAQRFYTSGGNATESWLVTERIEGDLLLDAITRGDALDTRMILLDVLAQLALLEQHGFYHDDVRTWNVMLAQGRARLIDFGSIGTEPRDCVWPHNVYLSFMIFVKEVVTGFIDNPSPIREIAISPFSLPQPYAAWLNELWARPVEQWSFRFLHDSLSSMAPDATGAVGDDAASLWMTHIEGALQAVKKHLHHVESEEVNSRSSIDARLQALDEKSDRMAQVYERHLSEVDRSRGELVQQLLQAQQHQQTLEAQLRESHAAVEHWHAQATSHEQRAQAHEDQATNIQLRASGSEQRITQVEALIAFTEQRASELERQALEHEQRALQFEQRALEYEQRAQLNAERASHSEQRVQDLLSNTSWFLTKPLRVVSTQGARASRGLFAATRASLRKSAVVLIRKTAGRPAIKRRIVALVDRYPKLSGHLRQFARNQGLLGGAPRLTESVMPGAMSVGGVDGPVDEALSARGREVLHKFEKAMKTKDAA